MSARSMNWFRKRALITGLLLIMAVNIFALAGVFYNRGGIPESALRLSERELVGPYIWGRHSENSGLSLKLMWRVLRPEPTEKEKNSEEWGRYGRYSGYQGEADWLNQAKLIALGFNDDEMTFQPYGRSRFGRQLPHDVLLVLELDGAAYQAALAQAIKYNRGTTGDLKLLADEQTRNSRLFVIDAALDSDASVTALRMRYPDRSRYAIVHGQIRPTWCCADTGNKISGMVSKINVDNLHVPLAMRGAFDDAKTSFEESEKTKQAHYEAVVAFGQRLEPWITAITRK